MNGEVLACLACSACALRVCKGCNVGVVLPSFGQKPLANRPQDGDAVERADF